MRIFATIDYLQSPIFPITGGNNPKNKFIYGAWMGAENFCYGLLKYGTFDEYHFFVDSKSSADLLTKNLSPFNFNLKKIKIINIRSLSSCLEKIKYTLFFTIGTDLSRLSYLRAKYAKECFPVCGIAFQTISYPAVLRADIFNNLLSDLYPFDAIICTSSAVKRVIQNLNSLVGSSFQEQLGPVLRFGGRLIHLPLGINASGYGRISKEEARKRLSLSKDKIVILYFGRFSLYDKADLYPLLAAFKEISAGRKNVLLLLAGVDTQGRYGAKLKKIAQEMGLAAKVKFILHNCLELKNMIYSASDIFVSPSDSIQESFGITVLEAMASGLPVVGSDWNGYKDLIAHNRTGFRTPTYWTSRNMEGIYSFWSSFSNSWERDHLYLSQSVCVDIKKMAEYLSILIKNKELRLKFGQNSRRTILERYDWSVLMPAYENLWQGLAKSARRHKIAQKQNRLFRPEYLDCFRHYPTKILNGRTKVALSKNGDLFLKTRQLPFRIQEDLEGIISIKIIFFILASLFKKNNFTIAEVEKYAKAVLKIGSAAARYNIMWMLKKDLLRLGS